MAKIGFVAQIRRGLRFPLPQTTLGCTDGHQCPEPGDTIQQGGTNLVFSNLTIEVPGHDSLAKELEASHLGFGQTSPVVATPLLPDGAPQTLSRLQGFIAGIRTL